MLVCVYIEHQTPRISNINSFMIYLPWWRIRDVILLNVIHTFTIDCNENYFCSNLKINDWNFRNILFYDLCNPLFASNVYSNCRFQKVHVCKNYIRIRYLMNGQCTKSRNMSRFAHFQYVLIHKTIVIIMVQYWMVFMFSF